MSAPHGRPKARSRIGVFGGSFDPVHVGHLALARSAAEAFDIDRMIVVPTGNSWQKTGTVRAQTPAMHRLAMIQIALRPLSEPRARGGEWVVDDLEVRRPGPSYTIDTLQTLRSRLGPEAALILILGSDQMRNLHTWHRYRDLLAFAHIAATQRERVPLAGLPEPVEHMVAQAGRQSLPDTPSGSIVFFQMPAVAVSATVLRQQLGRGEMPEELLPPGVSDYIRQHHLYHHRTAADNEQPTTDDHH
jgi:nicotinate-nucleotide adenylyltransferase